MKKSRFYPLGRVAFMRGRGETRCWLPLMYLFPFFLLLTGCNRRFFLSPAVPRGTCMPTHGPAFIVVPRRTLAIDCGFPPSRSCIQLLTTL